MDWYVIQAYSGYEQKVKAAIEERIILNNLSEKFGEILIPTEQIVELKRGTKKTTERKFFPGYVLAKMEMNDETYHMVKACLLYTSPSPRDRTRSRMPSSA